MLWTVLTVIFVVGAFLVVASTRYFPGRKTRDDVQEQGFRLWSGLWKKDDADRLR